MRYYLSAVLLLIISFFAVDVFAQSSDTEVLKDKVERLESDLAELKELLKQQVEKDAEKEKEIASLKEKDAQKEKDLSSLKVEVQKKEVVAVSESPSVEETTLTQKSAEFSGKKLAPAFGGVYTKPFLRRFGRNTYVGGYMDFQFRATEAEGGDNGFDQTRFIPFIYSDISDLVKLASEI